jgi:restriction system protein
MMTVSFVVTALVITLLLGAAATAWLWRIHCPRLTAAAGLRALAAMRWREFSRFVIEALQAQGFEASRLEPSADRGQKADLLLNRDGQTWLLTCKQGVDYRINRAMVDELARAIRISGASGGILATLGRIEPGVRKHAGEIELLDGAELWPLIDPLLPPSLHDDLLARARRDTARLTLFAWGLALAVGLLLATVLANLMGGSDDGAVAPTAPAASAPATTAETPAVAPPESSPLSEEEQRVMIERSVAVLPGIVDAGWATRSTLLVQLSPEVTEPQIDAICDVLEDSEALRASRVQLQPPPGSETPVRFIQCRTF